MKQVFQTYNPLRWKKFKWAIRIFLLIFILAATISASSLYNPSLPVLPGLSADQNDVVDKSGSQSYYQAEKKHSNHSGINKNSAKTNTKHYSFDNFKYSQSKNSSRQGEVKAAFYVNWDLQSYNSLRENIDQLTMVMPEWFILTESTDSISVDIDSVALKLMRSHDIKIVPMLTNFSNMQWNGENVYRIINDAENRQKIIKSILYNLTKYDFHGINVDFEDLIETTDESVILFQKELYECLHDHNFLVTQDIPPGNADYNIRELQHYNDYLVIMAYDQHNATTGAGDIASISWVENAMNKIVNVVDPGKLILGLCSYGYDWQENERADNMSFARAMALAKSNKSEIIFDRSTFSVHFNYLDENNYKHSVYFNDAISNFNTMRLGYEYQVGGFAVWRLGEEDQRLWSFFGKSLMRDSISDMRSFTDVLQTITTKNNVTYTGDGDVLDVICTPESGIASIEADDDDKLIVEQKYTVVPSGYEIVKSGKKEKKVVLSFDDGPDEQYTNQVIEILQREKIPASFFLLGLNAQNNIPLVKKLYDCGYELGNHSYTHPNFTVSSSFRMKLELRSTRQLIQCITGRSSILFRPPFNGDDFSEAADEIYPIAVSKSEHYYTIGSSIDPRDWEKNVTAEQIVQRVIESEENGNIILLHDGGGKREETIKALPDIIHYFKGKGYTFTTIADLMGKTRNDVMPYDVSDFGNIKNYANLFFASFLFYSKKVLFGLFLFAILLVMMRTLIIAVLAIVQKIKSKKLRPVSIFNNELVSVIVPAHNEETTISKTIEALLSSHYDKLEIIVVDDGSTDGTYEKLSMYYSNNKNIRLFSKPNAGKASALNFGIQHAAGPIVVCIDADTMLKADAIQQLLNYFVDEKTAGVAGNVKVGNEFSWLTKWQSIEYITGQNFDRRAFDLLNCITIIPGAIGAFRKDRILEAGGFSHHTLAEDCDLTMHLLKAGYSVKYSPKALAYTEVPETLKMFLKQRFRWTFGVMQSFWKHRRSFLNPRTGMLGTVAMPNILLFQFILPLLVPFIDIIMIVCLFDGQGLEILKYYLIFIAIDAAGALLAFSFENEKTGRLWLLIPQRIVYRWLMGYVLYKALLRAIRGELVGWGNLIRTGNVEYEVRTESTN